jgi:hypothetical protein
MKFVCWYQSKVEKKNNMKKKLLKKVFVIVTFRVLIAKKAPLSTSLRWTLVLRSTNARVNGRNWVLKKSVSPL